MGAISTDRFYLPKNQPRAFQGPPFVPFPHQIGPAQDIESGNPLPPGRFQARKTIGEMDAMAPNRNGSGFEGI